MEHLGATPNEKLAIDLAEVLQDLGRCIVALSPYQDQVVLTGGLVPVIYRFVWPDAVSQNRPLLTYDLDWAVKRKLAPVSERTINDLLLDSGFVRNVRGFRKQPITAYHHNRHQRGAPIYAEFLAPRRGGPLDRRGRSQEVAELQNGFSVQLLPYLELLLEQSVEFDAATISALKVSNPTKFRLPHPGTYLLQKVLIRDKRTPEKQANDLAHIYDVVLLSRKRWNEIDDLISQLATGTKFPKTWFARARRRLEQLFHSSDADGPREVAFVYSSLVGATAPPTPEGVYQVMKRFLDELHW